jgi:hypothetical protein
VYQDLVIQKRETLAQSILNSKVLLEIIELHEIWECNPHIQLEDNDLIFANEVSQALQRHTKRLEEIGFLTPEVDDDL